MSILGYILIFLLPALFAWKLIHDTRGVCYFIGSLSTDNEKVVRASSEISILDWPSKMHSIDYNRSQLREYWTIFLHLLGKIKGDNLSDHMNITLSLIANCISSILIFFIFKNLFGIEIGFIIFLLYVTSFWPYYVSLYMGHVYLAQMFFLISVLFLQLTGYVDFIFANIFFFMSGIFAFVSFFSSSASRKYPPILFIALLFVLRDHLILPWRDSYPIENVMFVAIITTLVFVVLIFRDFFVNWIFLSIFKKVSVDTEKTSMISGKLSQLALVLYFCLLAIAIFFNLRSDFILPLVSYHLGMLVILIHILLPLKTLPENITRYYVWLNVSSWASHFNSYPDKMKTFGFDMPNDFKGAGIEWVHYLFLRFMPVVYPLYIASVIVLLFIIIIAGYNISLNYFIVTVVVSMLPIFIHEFTGGLKVGKAYAVSLPFLLLVIALTIKEIIGIVAGDTEKLSMLWSVAGIVVAAQLLHSLYVLYSDTIPCRMAPAHLRKKLKELHVDTFYTYDNPYNDSFVKTMVSSYPDEFNVKYIDSLSDISRGIVVIPAVSSKSVSMETQQYAILDGDFNKDLSLNNLLKDKSIEDKALMKIPTMGSSKYYVHESEVTSYRSFILKQISDFDRWLGNAWILEIQGCYNKDKT